MISYKAYLSTNKQQAYTEDIQMTFKKPMTFDNLAIIEREAIKFRQEAWLTGPRIISGHPVAHEDPTVSRIKNFSTITKIVALPDGRKVFLIYRYPLSWVHTITDGIQRVVSGKRSIKPFSRRTWQTRFEDKSRIDVLHSKRVPGVVAMPYIPNWNLWDILQGNAPTMDIVDLFMIFEDIARQVNAMHKDRQTWGELIVHNMIVSTETGKIIICDTEVEYFKSCTDSIWRQASDWHDLIFSACGALRHNELEFDELAEVLYKQIHNPKVQELLADQCLAGRTWGQKLFWDAMSGRLSTDLETYKHVCDIIYDLR